MFDVRHVGDVETNDANKHEHEECDVDLHSFAAFHSVAMRIFLTVPRARNSTSSACVLTTVVEFVLM